MQKSIRYYMAFGRAVSLLSVCGYYLEGFIEDEESLKNKYEIFQRCSSPRVPVAEITRDGIISFNRNYSNSKKCERGIREAIRRNRIDD